MSPSRGRPRKPKTVRVQALLYSEQKLKLEFLSSHLPGSPPITGLVRDAVEAYVDEHLVGDLGKLYSQEVERRKKLQIVR